MEIEPMKTFMFNKGVTFHRQHPCTEIHKHKRLNLCFRRKSNVKFLSWLYLMSHNNEIMAEE